jgi:hypothetical protein
MPNLGISTSFNRVRPFFTGPLDTIGLLTYDDGGTITALYFDDGGTITALTI